MSDAFKADPRYQRDHVKYFGQYSPKTGMYGVKHWVWGPREYGDAYPTHVAENAPWVGPPNLSYFQMEVMEDRLNGRSGQPWIHLHY